MTRSTSPVISTDRSYERRLPLLNDAEADVFQRVRSTASGGLAGPAGTVRRGSLAGPVFLVAFRLFFTIDRIVAH